MRTFGLYLRIFSVGFCISACSERNESSGGGAAAPSEGAFFAPGAIPPGPPLGTVDLVDASVAPTPVTGSNEPGSAKDSGVREAATERDTGAGDVSSPAEEPKADAAPPQCKAETTWKGMTNLGAMLTPAIELFGSLSQDELTVAWATSNGGDGALYYANRTSIAEPFSNAKVIPSPKGKFAFDRVALSADGLRLVAVNGSKTRFLEMQRANRITDFGQESEESFAPVNTPPTEGEKPTYLGDPVFAPGDAYFAYSTYGPTELPSIRTAVRASNQWIRKDVLLRGDPPGGLGKRLRISAITADLRTIFYFDEQDKKAKASWSADTGLEFNQTTLTGPMLYAQPNATCTRLYFSSADDAGTPRGLFVATP